MHRGHQGTGHPVGMFFLYILLGISLACGGGGSSSEHPAPLSSPSAPVITAPDALTANQTGNTATVPAQAGCTFTWGITGGTITSASTGTSITFPAGDAGTLTLHCTASNQAGSTIGTKDITISATPVLTITDVSASSSASDSASISWTTNLAATSAVDYETTVSYGQTSPVDAALVISHSVLLSGLSAGTTYHVRVRSTDSGANEVMSGDSTITTLSLGAPTLGAHFLKTQDEGLGVDPITTSPVTTQASGSTLLAVSLQYNSNDAAPTDSYHNTWTALGSKHVYPTWPSWYHALWGVADANGGSGHTLSVVKAGNAAGEASLALIEIVNGGMIKEYVYAWSDSGSPNTTPSVTTDGPAVLIAVWCGDTGQLQMTAVPDNGFTVFDSYLNLGPTSAIQVALAAKQVTTAGTYTTTWTGTPVQGAGCFLIAVQ